MKLTAIFLCALAALVLVLSGCATQQPVTLAQLTAQVKTQCAVVQPFIVSMQAAQSQLNADAQADLAVVQAKVTQVCSVVTADASTTVTTPSIQDMVTAGFPALIKVVDASNLSQSDKGKIELAIAAAQAAVSLELAKVAS